MKKYINTLNNSELSNKTVNTQLGTVQWSKGHKQGQSQEITT